MQAEKKYYATMVFGCQMNTSDSERLAGQARQLGYTYTEDMFRADLILISTCCVRESAEEKAYGRIGGLKRLKNAKADLIIAVTGCMAQKNREKLLKRVPHVDVLLGTHNLHQLGQCIDEVRLTHKPVVAVWEEAGEKMPDIPVQRRGCVAAWVPIMYGCNNFCTYCIVPYVRGRERSRPIADITKEILVLVEDGFKEVTLLGQNVNSYGKDLHPSQTFADLLIAVDQLPGLERIRYMTSHPRDVSDIMITAIRDGRHICEHFHLPIQSGSNEILKRMNRGYSAETYMKLVEKIRAVVPGASFTTDIIVGFPGETEEHFQETLALVKQVRFDAAYTFLYSKRSGTPAADMAEQVPQEIKKSRLQRLLEVQNRISLEINKKFEGTTVSVLAEGASKKDPGIMMGRTRTHKIVLWPGDDADVGKIADVKIETAQTWQLKGVKA
jgi:tRNA-2-methylthio-N6-dimethylallyladenosine synthase